jgi:uncharacterized membrane protein
MNRTPLRRKLLLTVAVLVIVSFFLFPPVTLLDKTGAIGYAVCHQAPDRTFHANGTPLPLCARCTGIYLGIIIGLGGMVVLRRQYALDVPPTRILLPLVIFILVMLFDGLNSLLVSVPGLPSLYPPQNWLRLVTGTFYGIAISTITYPVFSVSLWHVSRQRNEAVIGNMTELLGFLLIGCVFVVLVLWQNPLLLLPLAILSTLGVVAVLGMIGTIIVLILSHREASARSWHDVAIPIVMGLAIAFLLIEGLGWFKMIILEASGINFQQG